MTRPLPPASLLIAEPDGFTPDPDLADWMRQTFIGAGAALHNPDHFHLQSARIGCLWTTAPNVTKGLTVVGQAEVPRPPSSGGAWGRARWRLQMTGWFGDPLPDFVITLSAPHVAEFDDTTFCALVEHELYHCGQAIDEYGQPHFSRSTGLPVFALRGHDVEEFVGVVRRYGAGAAAGATRELVEAAKAKPQVAAATVAAVCGNCLQRAA